MVVLTLEIAWHLCSANWTLSLVIQVLSHALNAESMAAWEYTWLDHQIKANTTICINLFIFFVIKLVKYFFDSSFHHREGLIQLLCALFYNHCIHLFFFLVLFKFSVLVIREYFYFVILVKEDTFHFDPIAVCPPLIFIFRQNSLHLGVFYFLPDLILYLWRIVLAMHLCLVSFIIHLLQVSLTARNELSLDAFIDQSLLTVKTSYNSTKLFFIYNTFVFTVLYLIFFFLTIGNFIIYQLINWCLVFFFWSNNVFYFLSI